MCLDCFLCSLFFISNCFDEVECFYLFDSCTRTIPLWFFARTPSVCVCLRRRSREHRLLCEADVRFAVSWRRTSSSAKQVLLTMSTQISASPLRGGCPGRWIRTAPLRTARTKSWRSGGHRNADVFFCQKKAEDFVLALDKVEADDIVEYRGLLLHNVDGVPADICFNRQATEDSRNAEWWMWSADVFVLR
jgi:hypothetical protein